MCKSIACILSESHQMAIDAVAKKDFGPVEVYRKTA